MDGLGHAVWAAKAERKFRPKMIVDNIALELALREVNELRNKNNELISKNKYLIETIKLNNAELLTLKQELLAYKQWDETKITFLPIKEINAIVCQYFNVSKSDMISPCRTSIMVLPRHIAFYLCKRHTVKSYPEIGRWYGNRDHTTVLHAFRKIELQRKSDPETIRHLDNLELLISKRLYEMRETTRIAMLPLAPGAVVAVPLVAAAPAQVQND